MKAKLGIWHDRVAVYFQDDPGGPFTIELDPEDRSIALFFGKGLAPWKVTDSYDLTGYDWAIYFDGVDLTGFARCTMMDVKFREAQNGLHCNLPANHELPWPHVRDCASYDVPAELMKECLMRRDSARDAGTRPTPPPGYVQMKMTPEMRVMLFTGI